MTESGPNGDSTGGLDPAARAALLADLALQAALGVDEALGDAPVDRFDEHARRLADRAAAPDAPPPRRPPRNLPKGAEMAPPPPRPAALPPAEGVAAEIAAACRSLEELRDALGAFDRCALKKGARSTVFCDGSPRARVMVIGEAPGREEDREGRPFVGRSGQLLDRMLAAIGLDRRSEDPATAAYISNVIPWRPLENRNPSDDEVAMMLPFAARHIELAAPDVLLLLGNTPTKALLETTSGITRMRGRWAAWRGIPVLPSFHPAYLLRAPALKRESWRDLLSLRARLDETPPRR